MDSGGYVRSKNPEILKDVLNHMRERLADYQEKYGDLYNLEATPAESTAYRWQSMTENGGRILLLPDMKEILPTIVNSSDLPVDYTSDIFDALDIQDEFADFIYFRYGIHAFLGETSRLEESVIFGAENRRKLPSAILYTVSHIFGM